MMGAWDVHLLHIFQINLQLRNIAIQLFNQSMFECGNEFDCFQLVGEGGEFGGYVGGEGVFEGFNLSSYSITHLICINFFKII